MTTKNEILAAIEITKAIAQAIRELREVPNGIFYARIMDKISFENYCAIINCLKRAELITEKNNVLIWTGDKV